ncbi:uncharacterized protein JCM6883_000983 [Sporobolomyces salmoneus]|uniref:uncharacterized protein n=1 Tax=Sporobolomyces salmoneus TaxID=183962 RepID=UPI0031711687
MPPSLRTPQQQNSTSTPSPSSPAVSLPSSSSSPRGSPRLVHPISPPQTSTPHGPLAGGVATRIGRGGRGRGASPARASSVQSRRSATSLGLGVQFANMNDLTSNSTGGGGGSGSGSKSPSPSRPSPPILSATTTTTTTHSRRSSLQIVNGQPPTPSTQNPPRRPSLTHLASFLSGIEHHTRVRSPGGRGVSRSASRSQSRAGAVRRRYRGVGSDGSELEGGDESEDDQQQRRSPRGGFSSEDEYLPEEDEPPEEEEEEEEGFMFGPPSQGSMASRRLRANSSRASSIRSRSRRSSVSRSEREDGSPHPLLHELVRENTTGGVGPINITPQTPNLQDAASARASEIWEETFETYKPSVLTTPTTPRIVRPNYSYADDEEPFLDTSAPNSPAMPQRRGRTYSSATTDSAVTQDLSTVEVFSEGERIGVDVWLEGRGGWVRDCFGDKTTLERDGKGMGNGLDGPRQLEVERRLGEGTYAIVYLVREILYEPDLTDDLLSPIDPLASFEFDSPHPNGGAPERPRLHSWASEVLTQPEPTYGRYYALKCLCKKDLTDELIEVQRGEAILHRALPKHENIVQLYGAYETDDWLFLVLEYVPGNDLFFWLLESQNSGTDHLYSRATSPSGEPYHQRRRSLEYQINRIQDSRDSDDDDDEADDGALSRTVTADTPAHLLMDQTPPSPSLLSSAAALSNGDSLLSRKRLRLISRMFSQMCDAVQACHDVGIAHRDIKPENFIVVDGKGDKRRWEATENARERGGVVVKITDWGLGTMEEMCEDFDCGSKPYMAYECRNNLRPTYDPRQADVWSLGLVLLNLLYHRNPWADPSLSDPDFSEYVDSPIDFLKERFEGIGDEVASFLADRVFCDVLEVVDGREKKRVSAGEFGRWGMKLVVMMGEGAGGFGGNPMFNGHHSAYKPSPLGVDDSTPSPRLDFSPVPSMPITIGSAASPSVPPASSLLSQFAPSTIKASNMLDELPRVSEEPEPSSLTRPAYITSPTQLSEDDSLPSPTFSSPNPTSQALAPATTSPESLYSPLPSAAASPDRALVPQRHSITSPHVSEGSLPPPVVPAVPLPWSAASPFAVPQAKFPVPPSSLKALPATSPSTATATPSISKSPSPAPLSPSISLLTATRNDLDGLAQKTQQLDLQEKGTEPPASPEDEAKSGGEAETTDAGGATKGEDKDGEKARSKRRKRGARKEKRAAKQAAQGGDVLDELAAASQDLARELSAASSPTSTFSKSSARSRPSHTSRSHGTQSTSALQTSLSTDSASTSNAAAKKGGMFGRLKTLVNEGNPDLEAFKRKIDERNASIGAKADTYSAPAKMQGGRRPPLGTPMSSRGSVGTASWGSNWSGIEGGDEAPRGRGGADKDDHWRSASSRRERLNDRRTRNVPPEFSSSVGSNSTRGTSTTNPLSNFDSSRNHTPLSSFSSIGSESMMVTSSSMSTSTSTVRNDSGETWRNNSSPASPPRRPYSSSRPSRGSNNSIATTKPKLKDVAIDTSDLGGSLPAPPLPPVISVPVQTNPTPPVLAPPRSPASQPLPASPSPTPPPASPSITSPPTPGKTNKLAKMLNSISVFNRQQGNTTQ